MPAFQAVPGMPYWLEFLSSDAGDTLSFCEDVLGWEDMSSDDDEWVMAGVHGLPVAGVGPGPDDVLTDMSVTYFHTADIERTVELACDNGGTVLAGPVETTVGQVAVLLDPNEVIFGVVCPPAGQGFVAAGEPGCAVWHELVCPRGFDEAVDFYSTVFAWTVDVHSEPGEGRYAVVSEEGAPFAGLWEATDAEGISEGGFWQSYVGVANLAQAVDAVDACGGQIVQPPTMSPFGPIMVVATATGITMTLCQVDEPAEQPHEGEELAGLDLSQFGLNPDGTVS